MSCRDSKVKEIQKQFLARFAPLPLFSPGPSKNDHELMIKLLPKSSNEEEPPSRGPAPWASPATTKTFMAAGVSACI